MIKKSNLIVILYFIVLATIPFILALTLRNKILSGDIINHTELEKQRFVHNSFENIENIILKGKDRYVKVLINTTNEADIKMDTGSAKVIELSFENGTLTINYDFEKDTTLNKDFALMLRPGNENLIPSEIYENDLNYYDERHLITVNLKELKSVISESGIVELYLDSNNIDKGEISLNLINSTADLSGYFYHKMQLPTEVKSISAMMDNSQITLNNTLFTNLLKLNLSNYSKVNFSGIEYNSCEITRDTSSGGEIDLKDLPKLKINVIE